MTSESNLYISIITITLISRYRWKQKYDKWFNAKLRKDAKASPGAACKKHERTKTVTNGNYTTLEG